MANGKQWLAIVAGLVLALLPVKGDLYAAEHKPSTTCSDYDLEEARITDELAKEPDRLRMVVTDAYTVDTFTWNLKWAFDIDVSADTLYIISALTPHSSVQHVHLFVVRNHCIIAYKLTWASVVAEMLRDDAWERGNPHVDGQVDRPVPPNRPTKS